MATSEKQLEYIKKHQSKLESIKVWVPAGDREKYKALAARCGVSLNALVVSLLDEKMKENPPPADL